MIYLKVFEDRDKYIVVLEAEEKVIESLHTLASDRNICGFFYGIGAVRNPEIGYFDLVQRKYLRRRLDGDFEVVSIIGNITRDEEENVIVHAHICLGDRDNNTYGGHLFEATVSVTLEIIVLPTKKILRVFDKTKNLKLIAHMLE